MSRTVRRKRGRGWHGDRPGHIDAGKKASLTKLQRKGHYSHESTKKQQKAIKNSTQIDSDKDGVVNKYDCSPFDPRKQEFGLQKQQRKAIEDRFKSPIEEYEISGNGVEIKLENGEEYLVYDSKKQAEKDVLDQIDTQLRDDLDSFDYDDLKEYIDKEELSRALVDDMYDGDYSNAEEQWNDDHPEKHKELKELEKERSESFKNKTNLEWHKSEKGKLYLALSKEREDYAENEANIQKAEIEEDPVKWWDDATGDPVPKLERYLDYDKAAKGLLKENGLAYYLSDNNRSFKLENGTIIFEKPKDIEETFD